MEYFGYGHIGECWVDPDTDTAQPKNKWNWYCSISDYLPFPKPVLAKLDDGYIEDVKAKNHFRVAVREIDDATFDIILEKAQLLTLEKVKKSSDILTILDTEIGEQTPKIGTVKKPKKKSKGGGSRGSTGGGPRSPHAKKIGDRGEELVFNWIKKNLSSISSARWVAKDKEKPGWDIEYRNTSGDLVAVEVKSSQLSSMSELEITANEWEAADKLGDNYWLYLVADCLGKTPTIERIQNPYKKYMEKNLYAEPSRFRIFWTE
jgi:hypothetical protein